MGNPGRGFQGRSKSRSRGQSNTNKSSSSGKRVSEMDAKDLQFRLGGPSNMTVFNRIMEYIRHSMVKSESDYSDDINTLLKEVREVDLKSEKPHRDVNPVDPNKKEQHDAMEKQLDIDYQEDKCDFLKRERAYKTNRKNATITMYRKCSTELQDRLKESNDFDDIEHDPIKMHNAILQLCTNYQDNQYKVSVHLASIKSFFNLKQKKEEPLKDYVQRVEVGLKQLQGISCIVLTKEIEMSKYQAASEEDRIALEDKAMDAMAGLIMVSGADKDYYGELQKDMQH
jgi:hypothetical protein